MKEAAAQHVEQTQGYVICANRKNAPRISVHVCERACRSKNDCEEYQLFLTGESKQKGLLFSIRDQRVICQQ